MTKGLAIERAWTQEDGTRSRLAEMINEGLRDAAWDRDRAWADALRALLPVADIENARQGVRVRLGEGAQLGEPPCATCKGKGRIDCTFHGNACGHGKACPTCAAAP